MRRARLAALRAGRDASPGAGAAALDAILLDRCSVMPSSGSRVCVPAASPAASPCSSSASLQTRRGSPTIGARSATSATTSKGFVCCCARRAPAARSKRRCARPTPPAGRCVSAGRGRLTWTMSGCVARRCRTPEHGGAARGMRSISSGGRGFRLCIGHGGPPKPGGGGQPRQVAAVSRATAVTVRGRTVTLWQFACTPAPAAPAVDAIPLGPDAQASWRAAALALPRSVPVLWRSVHHASRDLPRATLLASHLAAPGFEERDRVLDGPSFGLTFFLLLTSVVLDVPLPDEVVASAEIDERGRIGPVDAIAEKIAGIMAIAPSVRRVLVAADQRDGATGPSRGHLDIVGVADAAEALRTSSRTGCRGAWRTRGPIRTGAPSSSTHSSGSPSSGGVRRWTGRPSNAVLCSRSANGRSMTISGTGCNSRERWRRGTSATRGA